MRVFNQTAFRSEVLRGMVDASLCRFCHFCFINAMGWCRFRIRGLVGVYRWIVVRVTVVKHVGALDSIITCDSALPTRVPHVALRPALEGADEEGHSLLEDNFEPEEGENVYKRDDMSSTL